MSSQSSVDDDVDEKEDLKQDEKQELNQEYQEEIKKQQKQFTEQQENSQQDQDNSEKEQIEAETKQFGSSIQMIQQCRLCAKQEDLLRCSACKSVQYCSTQCQKDHWSKHKIECKKIQENNKNSQNVVKSIKDFQILKFLGQGNFSEVFSVREKKTEKNYAIKQINKRKLAQVNKEKDVFMEKHCLSRLDGNEYVIRIYSTFQDDDNLYMQLEFVEGGELWKQIHVFGAISQSLIKYYFAHIVKAINSIHQKQIIHRDIKSENIIIGENHSIKFIDFGTARDLAHPEIKGSGNGRKGKRNYEHYVGTPQFMPPECIRNQGSDYKSDVYSLGCLFYQLISGCTPFEAKSEYLIFTRALEEEIKFPESWIFTEDQMDLIKKMTAKDMESRYSMNDVMSHPYWGSQNWDQILDYQSALDQMTNIERYLYERKIELYKLNEINELAQQILKLDEIIKISSQFKGTINEQEEIQSKLKYLENQVKLLLRDKDQ